MENNKLNNSEEKVRLTANILFSGIGAQERGFRNSNLFDIDILVTSDISKEATLSYAAIHCGLTNEMVDIYKDYPSREEMAQYLTDINLGYEPEKNKKYDWFKLAKRKKNDLEKYWLATKLSNNLGDISLIEELPYADFWSISFCCQDISVAGKMKGLKPDSGTRSSLLWDNIKLLEKAREKNELPKYVMFENVKNLVSKKFINDFNDLIDVMGELGFNTYWKVLNGKECGIAQNRERVFVICIRKYIDTGLFEFPAPFDNGLRLKDFLEDSVDEKYYLSDIAIRKFKLFDKSTGENIKVAGSLNPEKKIQDRVRVLDPKGISQGLRTTDCKEPVKIITGIDKSVNDTKEIDYANCLTTREDRGISNRKSEGTAVLEQAGRIYNSECLSPTLDTCSGGNRMPKILENRIYPVGSLSSSQDAVVVDPSGISKTHTAGHNNQPKIICDGWIDNKGTLYVYPVDEIRKRIRKLTERECARLMGFTDEDNDRCAAVGVASTHLYKNYGNSIITNCVELIAEHLYKAQYDNTFVCFDENFTQPQVEN